MRVAALYDVHGNLPALEAVLADSRCVAADVVVSGGDLGSGPMPAEALDRLLELGDEVRFARSNVARRLPAQSRTVPLGAPSDLGPSDSPSLRPGRSPSSSSSPASVASSSVIGRRAPTRRS